MYALNNITNAVDFEMSSVTSTANKTLTLLIDPHLKILGHCLDRTRTTFFGNCNTIPTLQQMMTPFPTSTQLCPTLLLNMPVTRLPWANSWRLIKPCKTNWMSSCRNPIQSGTKWTTAIHMQKQNKTDLAHSDLFILCLTKTNHSNTTPDSTPIFTALSSTTHDNWS